MRTTAQQTKTNPQSKSAEDFAKQSLSEERQSRVSTHELDAHSAAAPLSQASFNFGAVPLFSASPMRIQPKLKINAPGDKYEQEADRVAEQVMRAPDPEARPKSASGKQIQQKPLAEQISPLIQRMPEPMEEEEDDLLQTKPLPGLQRKCAKCEAEEQEAIQRKSLASQITPIVQRMPESIEDEEEDLLQTKSLPDLQRKCAKCEEEEEKHTVQTKTIGSKPQTASSSLSSRIQSTRGRGQAMDVATHSFMSGRFGTDFSSVRIHTDSAAAQMNREINAQAFTVGKDIYFNSGKYRPNSGEGKRLLAHELTHVVQQEGTSKRIFKKGATAERLEKSKCNALPKTKTEPFEAFFNAKTIHQVTNGVPKKLYRPPNQPCTSDRNSCDLDQPEINYKLETGKKIWAGDLGGYGDLFRSVCFKITLEASPQVYWVQKDYVTKQVEQPAQHRKPKSLSIKKFFNKWSKKRQKSYLKTKKNISSKTLVKLLIRARSSSDQEIIDLINARIIAKINKKHGAIFQEFIAAVEAFDLNDQFIDEALLLLTTKIGSSRILRLFISQIEDIQRSKLYQEACREKNRQMSGFDKVLKVIEWFEKRNGTSFVNCAVSTKIEEDRKKQKEIENRPFTRLSEVESLYKLYERLLEIENSLTGLNQNQGRDSDLTFELKTSLWKEKREIKSKFIKAGFDKENPIKDFEKIPKAFFNYFMAKAKENAELLLHKNIEKLEKLKLDFKKRSLFLFRIGVDLSKKLEERAIVRKKKVENIGPHGSSAYPETLHSEEELTENIQSAQKEHGILTDKEFITFLKSQPSLSEFEKEGIRNHNDKIAKNREVITAINEEPRRLLKIPRILEYTEEKTFNFAKGSIHDRVYKRQLEIEKENAPFFEKALTWIDVGLLLAAYAIPHPAIKAAAAVGSLIITSIRAKQDYDRYVFDKKLGNLSYDEAENLAEGDPDLLWLAEAFVFILLDIYAATKAIKALRESAKALKATQSGKALAAFKKEVDAADNILDRKKREGLKEIAEENFGRRSSKAKGAARQGRKIAKAAQKGVVRRGTQKEAKKAARYLKAYRKKIRRPSKGHYGYAEGSINGHKIKPIPVKAGPPDSPDRFKEIFIPSKVNWVRNTDSEYKTLNRLANFLGAERGGRYPNIQGKLEIVSENKYCRSCRNVIDQFHEMFPNVDLILIDGIK